MSLPRINGEPDYEHHEELQDQITTFLKGPNDNQRTAKEQLELIQNWLSENLSNVEESEQRHILWSIADMNMITNVNVIG
jgi:hypothetical protein